MRGLPIVDRELREAARRPITWRIRLAIATSAVLVWAGLVVVYVSLGTPQSMQGRIIFSMLCGMLGWYALMTGPTLAADVVSQEKRDGTLGLLFLTDLKPRDIILGKLVGRGLGAFYGLLGMLPVLGMSVLVGGVAGTMVWRTALALYDILFFSMAIAVWVSTMSRVERKALMTTILICLGAVFGPMGVAFYLSQMQNVQLTPVQGAALALPSLATPLVIALEPPFPVARSLVNWTFAGSIALHQFLAWLALWHAGRILKHSWQDANAGRIRLRWREWIHWWRLGSAPVRRAHRQRWLDRNPFTWLAMRELRKPLLVWVYLTGVFLGLAWGYWRSGRTILTPDVIAPWTVILIGLMKVWVGTEALRNLADERRGGSVELLVTTPLSVNEILRGQWMALRRQFLVPFVALAGGLLLSAAWVPDEVVNWPGQWRSMVMVYILTSAADLWALGWVGMWQGLSSPTTNRGITQTVVLVLFMPWLGFYLGAAGVTVVNWMWTLTSMMGGVTRSVLSGPIEITPQRALWIWCFWNLAWALALGVVARRTLKHHFREIVAHPKPIELFRKALGTLLRGGIRPAAAPPRGRPGWVRS